MKELIKTLSDNLVYKGYELKDNIYYVFCETKTKKYKHPITGVVTKSIKDTRKRILSDTAFNGKEVKIVVTLKVFAFKDKNKVKEYITEKLDFVSDLYKKSQRTSRLENYILDFSNNSSAIATEKSLKRNGIKISDTTINRLIKKKQQK